MEFGAVWTNNADDRIWDSCSLSGAKSPLDVSVSEIVRACDHFPVFLPLVAFRGDFTHDMIKSCLGALDG